MRRGRRGATMFAIVLFLSVVITGASALYIDTILANGRFLDLADHTVKARAAAEAAVEKLLLELETVPEGQATVSNALYQGELATGQAEARKEPEGWRVTAVGQSGTATSYPAYVTLDVLVTRRPGPEQAGWTVVSWVER